MQRIFFLILSWVALLCFLGTTYVIQEEGAEVGRWIEEDGKDTVEVIENEIFPREGMKGSPRREMIKGGVEETDFDRGRFQETIEVNREARRERGIYNLQASLRISKGMKLEVVERKVQKRGGQRTSKRLVYAESRGRALSNPETQWLYTYSFPSEGPEIAVKIRYDGNFRVLETDFS